MISMLLKSEYLKLCMLAIASLMLLACSEKDKLNGANKDNSDTVIAKINDEPVYASDLEALKDRMLANVPKSYIDKAVEKKLLDSLIQSKAMAQLMNKELDDAERMTIDAKVRAFREDLLVRTYVEKHKPSSQISNDQVKKYYADNPQLFGGGFKKSVEYIEAGKVDDRERRVELLTELTNLKDLKQWQPVIEKLKSEGFQMDHKEMTVNEQHLKSPIKEAVMNMDGDSSPQLLSEFGIFLVRVKDVQKIPPKPLAQVSGDIRKLLQRQAYRKSVEKLSEQVMKQVKVELLNGSNVD